MSHIRSSVKGLSHARNIGITKASGDFLLFPDDDSEYPENLLENIQRLFDGEKKRGLVSGRIVDKERGKVTLIKCPLRMSEVTLGNMWFTVTSGSLAVRRSVIKNFSIKFDERFGLGGIYKSAEELDFVAKIIKSGSDTLYEPELTFYHPEKELEMSDDTIARAGAYAYGTGAVCCKLLLEERVLSVIPFFVGRVIRPLLMWMLYLLVNKRKAMFYRAYLVGRISGFKDFFKECKKEKKQGAVLCV